MAEESENVTVLSAADLESELELDFDQPTEVEPDEPTDPRDRAQ